MISAGCGSKNVDNGQEINDHYEKSDTTVVDLKGVTDEKVIVYVSGLVRVMVSYNSLMSDLDDHIEKHDVQYDKDLKKELVAMVEKNDTLNMVDIKEDRMLHKRLAFRLAEILERGEAVILNTKTNEKVEKIMIEYYEVMFHKLAGRGGRLFFLPDKTVFLEVTDWIS